MMHALSRPYASRYGRPVLNRYDPRIFTLRYFGACMDCTSCGDACCQYGADIEMPRMTTILQHADALEQFINVSREQWFRTDPDDIGILPDGDYPGGEYSRTGVAEIPVGRSPHNTEACVFLDPVDRGCRLHRFGLANGIDVHEIKPMVCILFPLSFSEGDLFPSIEFDDDDLVCSGPGPTVYENVREDLRYYFGDELIAELDAMQPLHETQGRGLALPVLA